LETSKIRMPRNRVSGVAGGVDEQSFLAAVDSTETNSRLPHTDTSFWLPGQDSAVFSTGAAGLEMS
jgi:hypothetical protein